MAYEVTQYDERVKYVIPNHCKYDSKFEAKKKQLEDYFEKHFDDFSKEIKLAKENNIKIYIVAIGSLYGAPIKTDNGFIKDKDNNLIISKKNQKIKNLALQTGGVYIDSIISNKDMDRLLDILVSQIEQTNLKLQEIISYKELFYYPLGVGLLLLLFGLASKPKRLRNA